MTIDIKGHSGCNIDIIEKDDILYIKKSTEDLKYLKRLDLQGRKQTSDYCLTDAIKNPVVHEVVCNDNGYYSKKEMKCLCEFCFFGKYCRYSGYYFWERDYRNLRVLYGILYGILGFMIWYYFIKKIIKESDCYKRILRVLFTPKYIIMIILLIISNSKIIYNFIV